MIPELGTIALLAALMLSVASSLLVWAGCVRRREEWLRFAPAAGVAVCLLVVAAFAVLVFSFLRDDFSVQYVAQHSHRDLPLLLKIAASWGGHEGSLLFWLMALTLWGGLFALLSRRYDLRFSALTLALMNGVNAAFIIFIVWFSSPFARLFPPAWEGRDLNPMLQHIALIIHPPLLYLGYAGFTLCAAMALGAVLNGRFDAAIAGWVRRWAGPAWGFLTAGIILGSWWAYCELGWGGWWFWDPVENASLLPWLSGTALLHSLAVSARRGIFRHWTLLLALFTFILSLLGTLIVRSGMLVSVHAFALDAERALPLLILFAGLSCLALGLYAARCDLRPAAARYFPFSRENLMLGALLLFTVVTLVVLIGTFYPMLYGLMGWGKISVGAPYFNLSLAPIAVLILLLMAGSGSVLWKSAPAPGKTALLGLAALACIVALLAAWLTGIGVLAAAIVGIIVSVMVAQAGPFTRINARLGSMLLAHTGVALSALGIVFSASIHHEVSVNLSPGQQTTLSGYQFRYVSAELQAKENYTAEVLRVDILREGKTLATVMPERRHYTARNQLMIEPGIHWGWMGSWYVVAGEKTDRERYAMRFYYQRGVQWIWLGGVLMIAGMMWNRMGRRVSR